MLVFCGWQMRAETKSAGGGGVAGEGLGRGFLAEMEEDERANEEFEQRGTDEAADDDDGDGVENFFARLVAGEDERDEGDTGGEGGHEDGDHALERAALDHRAGETLALVAHEVKVMRNHHDAVARGDAAHGDETDERGDADVVDLEPRVDEAADERERDAEHDLQRERPALKVAVEKKQNDGEDGGAEENDALGGILLGAELALVGDEVALG